MLKSNFMIAPPLRFTPEELLVAADAWACRCGPAAVAAACGLTLEEVRPALGPLYASRGGYMQRDHMRAALTALCFPFAEKPNRLPFASRGVNRLQLHGPWMLPNVPFGARYSRSHWIASARSAAGETLVFDANAPDWLPMDRWLDEGLAPLLARVKKCDGQWSLTSKFEVSL